jgi:hypothetical protein
MKTLVFVRCVEASEQLWVKSFQPCHVETLGQVRQFEAARLERC